MWPTIRVKQAEDCPSERNRRSPSLDSMAKLHGLPAPANPSTLGSRQGLWLTPRANEPDNDPNFAARNADRGAHCHGTLSSQAKQLWPTITAHTPDMESNGPNGHSGTYLAGAVKAEEQKEWRTPTVAEEKNQNTSKQIYLQNQVGAVQKQWATPNAFCFQPPENTEQWTKRAEFQQTEKGVNLHKPIQTQVLHEVEKQWATPRLGGEEKAETRLARGKDIGLHGQVGAMTNSAKLNPRWVETLMGLPVGWTMPSCASPVTIALTNCASSATESCQQQQNELFAF